MLHEKETFPACDIRGLLRNWMKENCLYPVRDYIQAEKVYPQTCEKLSLGLVDRSGKTGLARSELLYNIENCGTHGEVQEHKTTKDRRYCGYYCQERKFHLPCAIRYRAGQGQEDLNQFMEVVKANDLWGFYKWEFTLPDESRKFIDDNPKKSKNFLQDVRKAVAKTIKAIFGVNTKARNLQPGFKILYHPVSSGDPFKQSSHFHALILPFLCDLKNKKTETFPKTIDHNHVKAEYKKNLDAVLLRYGQEAAIKNKYVVHMAYVEKELESSVIHSFKYNNRSMVQDVLNKIKRVHIPDHDEYVCLIHDKERDVYIPEIKTESEILDAIEYILNPVVSVRMAYGFLRQIERYSGLLNIERDEFEQDENWEKLYEIKIRRVYRTIYNKEKGKLERIIEIYIRRADSYEEWKQIKPDELRGERSAMGNRKLYKARS